MCATVTWAVIMFKTSGDTQVLRMKLQCSALDIIWKPQNAHIALGSYYSLKRLEILFFYLQRAGRGKEKTGKSLS